VARFKKAFTNFGKDLSSRVQRGIKESYWNEIAKSGLVGIILGFIKKGTSVVQGEGRFQKYSDGYVRAIKGIVLFKTKDGQEVSFKTPKTKGLGVGKKQSPVNLTVSGDMLDSLKFIKSNGTLKFTSKLARYHNDGEGNLPERRLLPNRDGERFNPRVRKVLRDSLSAAIRKQSRSLSNIGSIKFRFK
jgi:hypothetical protein